MKMTSGYYLTKDQVNNIKARTAQAQKAILLARTYRVDHGENSGYVTVFDDEVTGWTKTLDRPGSYLAGNLAVSPLNEVFISVGGDDWHGATAWVQIDMPATEESAADLEQSE